MLRVHMQSEFSLVEENDSYHITNAIVVDSMGAEVSGASSAVALTKFTRNISFLSLEGRNIKTKLYSHYDIMISYFIWHHGAW